MEKVRSPAPSALSLLPVLRCKNSRCAVSLPVLASVAVAATT
jgi:hypothetical protein